MRKGANLLIVQNAMSKPSGNAITSVKKKSKNEDTNPFNNPADMEIKSIKYIL